MTDSEIDVAALQAKHHTLSIFRLPKVKEITGKGRSSIYAEIKDGTFPPPVKLGARAVGWKSTDVYDWMNSLTQKQTGNADRGMAHGR
nr:AlpA family transcriptional regulator [Pseudomonas sp.]